MTKTILLVLFLLTPLTSRSADVYLVQADARGYLNSCETVSWITDAVFYNRGTTTATVSFKNTSNGAVDEAMALRSFAIPAGRSASLSRMTGRAWAPRANAPLWVTTVDVDGEVDVKDVLLIGTDPYSAGCIRISGNPIENRGRAAYPVFRELAAANEPQIHLATYLGAETPGRLNVGIYNAAPEEAMAAVEVRRHCDEAVVAFRSIPVQANTIIQVPIFSGVGPVEGCPLHLAGELGGPPRSLYTIVKVDQPSFSYVANVIDSQAPVAGIVISPP